MNDKQTTVLAQIIVNSLLIGVGVCLISDLLTLKFAIGMACLAIYSKG